ncbi:MAG: hypothetical protein Q9209_006187 [Squamulea sp. 1 TL-2023]
MQHHVSQSMKSTHDHPPLLRTQVSSPPADLGDDPDKPAQLSQIPEWQYRDWPTSRYSDVSVLLLKWAADNIGVIDEVRKLRNLLQNRFYFTAEIWDIPSDDPEDELTREILRFRKGKKRDSLIILYYAGHGGGDKEECIWTANSSKDSPSLNWHNVQGHLLGHQCDTLFILDCCYASLAASIHSTGNNWFLGASVKESEATGVSWKSFTSAMTRSLERAANKYWSERRKYSLHTLSYDLNLWERDLPVTPNFVPLNERGCEPTDLTPLLYARARPMLASARTEPVVGRPNDTPGMPSLPQRPRRECSAPTAESVLSPTIQQDDQEGFRAAMVAIEIPIIGACQTVRIRGLLWDTVAEDVTCWLRDTEIAGLADIRPGPIIHNLPTKTSDTIATLPSIAVAKQALKLWGNPSPGQTDQLKHEVNMDIQFEGLTTIYISASAPNHEPNVDIVFVHGAYGHPINSFASHYVSSHSASTSIEICWPRDELPELLESSGVFPRVMTYGWHADAWLSPSEKVSSSANDLHSQLRHTRLAAPTRPLVFIGHGLGGILIKETVNNTIYSDEQEGHFETPVKLCCFLATPHRGADRDEDFASILTAMKSLKSPRPLTSPQQHMQDLKARNPTLVDISSGFDTLRQEYGISLLSARESVKTADRFIVPVQSAILSGSQKDRFDFDCNYLDLARLPKALVNRDTGLRILSDSIVKQLKPREQHVVGDPPQDSKLAKRREQVIGRLRKYDTVFLIDDSESMYGRRWLTASRVLSDVAAIAVRYDKDGVDLKFFNYPLDEKDGKNIDSSAKVMELFSKVDPAGPTLTADLLEEELNEYMYQYKPNRSKKGLNLIILTDGEPEPGQDVEQVIVKYANQLRDSSAPLFQVGIQFVQVGADSNATAFLRRLDSRLKEAHNLDRDIYNLETAWQGLDEYADSIIMQMIDTVHWVPGDEDRLFEKILLGGILKQLDDKDEADGNG